MQLIDLQSLASLQFPGFLSESFLVLFVLAIAPVVFLLLLFTHLDRYKKESKKLMTVTFLIGALCIIPAIIIELVLANFIPLGPGLVSIFIYFIFGVALVEESLKFFAVRVYAYNSPLFDEPMDGIVLGACAGLGFATVENLLYVFQYGALDAVVRALISVPGHAFYGAIIGYYLGEAKFKKSPGLAAVGLSIAIFLHGLFDTLTVILPTVIGIVILFGLILFVYYGIVRREVRTAEAESPHKPFVRFFAAAKKLL